MLSTTRRVVLGCVLALGVVSLTACGATSAADSALGPAIGKEAPAFELVDQHGNKRGLAEFTKKGKTALVFFRSADWCPYCQKQLIELQADSKRYDEAGISVVAIGYDSPAVLAKFAAARKITYPLLSDGGSKTIDAYGLRNPAGDGIPFPGTLLLDGQGIVRAKSFAEDYKVRQATDELLKAAAEMK